MVRAMRDTPIDAPAPESLQSMLRMAAQLEELADSQAPHRKAAARAILPPAKASNQTLEVAAAKVAVKPSPVVWKAASPPLPALLPFIVLLSVLIVLPALLLVFHVFRRAIQDAKHRGARPAG